MGEWEGQLWDADCGHVTWVVAMVVLLGAAELQFQAAGLLLTPDLTDLLHQVSTRRCQSVVYRKQCLPVTNITSYILCVDSSKNTNKPIAANPTPG